MSERICSILDCNRPACRREWCNAHYRRGLRAGTIPLLDRSLGVRFWAKVDRSGNCWLWTGGRTSYGYGKLSTADGIRFAHRIVYEWAYGPIPTGLCIDHLCHNADMSCPGALQCRHRLCVNPTHMEAVEPGINVSRGHRWKKAARPPAPHSTAAPAAVTYNPRGGTSMTSTAPENDEDTQDDGREIAPDREVEENDTDTDEGA